MIDFHISPIRIRPEKPENGGAEKYRLEVMGAHGWEIPGELEAEGLSTYIDARNLAGNLILLMCRERFKFETGQDPLADSDVTPWGSVVHKQSDDIATTRSRIVLGVFMRAAIEYVEREYLMYRAAIRLTERMKEAAVFAD